jgi:cytochrome-b5 reductase
MHRSSRVILGSFAAAAVAAAAASSASNNPASADLKAFSPDEFRKFPVTRITTLSHNTKAIECALPSPAHETGMPVSSCIMIRNDAGVAKPYTPTTLTDDKGSFELVVKVYPGGKVSGFLHGLQIGDAVEVKGPFKKLDYKANMKKQIGMLAGGTGITPCLQVIKEILKNPADTTEIRLVYANDKEEDILLKPTLDALAKKHRNFHVSYVLAKPVFTFSWEGDVGYVSDAIVAREMPQPSKDTLVLVCGPPPFMKAVSGDKTPDYKQGPVEGMLKAAGYTEDMVFKF